MGHLIKFIIKFFLADKIDGMIQSLFNDTPKTNTKVIRTSSGLTTNRSESSSGLGFNYELPELDLSDIDAKRSRIYEELSKKIKDIDNKPEDSETKTLNDILDLLVVDIQSKSELDNLDKESRTRERRWLDQSMMDLELAIHKYNSEIDKVSYGDNEIESAIDNNDLSELEESLEAEVKEESGNLLSNALSILLTKNLIPRFKKWTKWGSNLFGGLLKRIKGLSLKLGGKLKSSIKLVSSRVKSLMSPVLNSLKKIMENVSNGFKKVFRGLMDRVLDSSGGRWLANAFDKGKNAIKNAASTVKNVAKEATEKVAKSATEKVAKEVSEKVVKEGAELAAKKGGKALLKATGGKIPGVGTMLAIGFAIDKASEGDLIGALLELASGICSLFPALGTALSYVFDGLSFAWEMFGGEVRENMMKATKDAAKKVIELANKAMDDPKSVLDYIRGVAQSAVDKAKAAASESLNNVVDGFKNGVSNLWDSVKSTRSGLLGSIGLGEGCDVVGSEVVSNKGKITIPKTADSIDNNSTNSGRTLIVNTNNTINEYNTSTSKTYIRNKDCRISKI